MAKKNGNEPLFVTEKVKGRILYRLFATSIFVGIFFVWIYRVTQIPSYSQEDGILRILVWIGMLLSELWFGFYWFLTQSVRWNRVHRRTFPDRLSQRSVLFLFFLVFWFLVLTNWVCFNLVIGTGMVRTCLKWIYLFVQLTLQLNRR